MAPAVIKIPSFSCFPSWACVLPQGVKIAPACEEASVRAFPTWVIGGSVTEGQLDLNALEDLLTQAQGSSSSSTEAAAVAAAQ
jgi:hypothetical protein